MISNKYLFLIVGISFNAKVAKTAINGEITNR